MAATVEWTQVAADELDRAAAYIAADSPLYAAVFVQEVLTAAASLADFPKRGRKISGLGRHTLRQLVIGSYLLIYRVHKSHVQILALIHGSRDFKDAWQQSPRNE